MGNGVTTAQLSHALEGKVSRNEFQLIRAQLDRIERDIAELRKRK